MRSCLGALGAPKGTTSSRNNRNFRHNADAGRKDNKSTNSSTGKMNTSSTGNGSCNKGNKNHTRKRKNDDEEYSDTQKASYQM